MVVACDATRRRPAGAPGPRPPSHARPGIRRGSGDVPGWLPAIRVTDSRAVSLVPGRHHGERRAGCPVRSQAGSGEWRSGSAPALGAGGRGFKSPLPDHRGGMARSRAVCAHCPHSARSLRGRRRGCSSMARASAFQADNAGSIPVTRSTSRGPRPGPTPSLTLCPIGTEPAETRPRARSVPDQTPAGTPAPHRHHRRPHPTHRRQARDQCRLRCADHRCSPREGRSTATTNDPQLHPT
jgi:hypothetical protein